jgi:signal transduction histidine kinase
MSWMRRWSWAIAMVVAIVITVGGLIVLESGRERIAREYEIALDARKQEIDALVAFARAGPPGAAQPAAPDSTALAASEARREAIDALLMSEERRAQSALEAARAGQRISTLCVGAVSALNIILFVLLFRNLGTQLGVQSREQERLLHAQGELDRLVRERTRQLEALARHLQNVGEEEKTKLARELHDELGAILTATKIDVASAQRRISSLDATAAEKLARAQGHLDQGIALKRRIVEDMRPTVLAHFGLVTALRTLCEEAAQRNGWRLSLALPDDDIRLDEALAIALFRVAQEALNNAAKYAHASRLSVALVVSGGDAELETGQASIALDIDDDGIGIAPADLDRARTHGLLGMRQRVAARGGTLDIGAGPHGNGTRVSARMPVKMQAL